jgi:TPR repeat protein
MYARGKGVRQDLVEAVKWYRLAAEQGNADAQLNLGGMYREGKVVRQDHVEAVSGTGWQQSKGLHKRNPTSV